MQPGASCAVDRGGVFSVIAFGAKCEIVCRASRLLLLLVISIILLILWHKGQG